MLLLLLVYVPVKMALNSRRETAVRREMEEIQQRRPFDRDAFEQDIRPTASRPRTDTRETWQPRPRKAEPPPPASGSTRVSVPGFGTVDLPPSMELQDRSYLKAPTKAGVQGVVFQQKGLNACEAKALERYARVIIETEIGVPGEFPSLDDDLSAAKDEMSKLAADNPAVWASEATRAEAKATYKAMADKVEGMTDAEFRSMLREMLSSDPSKMRTLEQMTPETFGEMRRTIQPRVIEDMRSVAPPELQTQPATSGIEVNGAYGLQVRFRREGLRGKGPVAVRAMEFWNHDRSHQVTVSYRLAERDLWEEDLAALVRSLRIADARDGR